jgi:hypothetical protein
MSATPYDRNEAFASYTGPLHARQKGERYALGMGVAASVILALTALLTRHSAPPQAVAEAAPAPAAVSAPAKIAAKAATGSVAPSTAATAATLDLDAPEFAHEKKVVAQGEPKDGGPRVDSLTIGQFAMGGPFFHVDIHPEVDPDAPNPDFFLDMTRHARGVGLNVAKIGHPAMVTTRFGAFETAEIRLAQPAGEGVAASERACLATRLVDPKSSVEIAGVACGAAAKPIDKVALGCVLDKLNYASGSDNKALNDFFLNAEIARGKGCANVSRDDMTASIPRAKAAAPAKTAAPVVKKPKTVARAPAVHPDPAKN